MIACVPPGMSGPELAEAAAERWPHLRFVLATGYQDMRAVDFPTILNPFDHCVIERVVGGPA